MRPTPTIFTYCSYLTAGTGTHTVDLVTYELRPDSLFFLAPGVALVAYELGFADASYFGRYFRKYTGRPPEAFRQQR